MLLRWLCVGAALAALVPAGCSHKRCCRPAATSAYPCCPQPCNPCAGGPTALAPVPPVNTQAFSAPAAFGAPAGGPGCCNGR